MSQPSVGRDVHYRSRGSADGRFPPTCRAAKITAVDEYQESAPGEFIGHVDLCVFNPTGLFFDRGVMQDEGAEVAGDPGCQLRESHGSPFRYCQCGWVEPNLTPGTWHWPERVDG